MKYYSFNPCIFPAMIRSASPDARAGSLVNVYNKEGQLFGAGLYNPKARVPLRVIFHSSEPRKEEDFLTSGIEGDLYADILLQFDRVSEHLFIVKRTGRKTFGCLCKPGVDTESLKIHSQLA